MKKFFLITLMAAVSVMAFSQSKIVLKTGGKSMTATLVENRATAELLELLEKGPINVQMNDYGGFEKVGALPQSFTTSNSQITTQPGDIMLYQGNNIVIFYDSNSWSYTPLGKVDFTSVSELKQFLGSGTITLTISLPAGAGIEETWLSTAKEDKVYDLNGNLIKSRPLDRGIYIINGRKKIV